MTYVARAKCVDVFGARFEVFVGPFKSASAAIAFFCDMDTAPQPGVWQVLMVNPVPS